jgi:primase-polymerase (primpol)-like protein
MTKPAILRVRVDPIPAELRAEPRWVVWKLVSRDGRWTKAPFRASDPSTPASSTDPATWGTFAHALAAYNAGRCDGIGFVLGDGWAGLDDDRCRDPHTSTIAPAAFARAERLNSYTEVSPSGTGIKTFFRVDPTWAPHANVITIDGQKTEIYARDRFFTVTGHVVEPFTNLREATATIHAISGELFANAPARVNLDCFRYGTPGQPAVLMPGLDDSDYSGADAIGPLDVLRSVADIPGRGRAPHRSPWARRSSSNRPATP